MARIILFDENGGPEKLYIKDVAKPEPGPGEVRYRVEAYALNRGDLFWLADTYYNSAKFPARIGQEAVGHVEAIGPGVEGFAIGQRVASLVQEDGRYCVNGEFAITPARYLVHCPDFLSAGEAASLWSQAQTAYYPLVEVANVGPGHHVLVTAGSSTSGNGAIQMAKLLGATVITTSRSNSKNDFLNDIGADFIIDMSRENLCESVGRITNGKGVDVILDAVAGPMMSHYLADGVLALGAKIFVLGALDGDFDLQGPLPPLIRAGGSIIGYSLYNHNRIDAQLERAKAFITHHVVNRSLVPWIDSVLPLEDTAKGYEKLLSGQTRGKVIVKVS